MDDMYQISKELEECYQMIIEATENDREIAEADYKKALETILDQYLVTIGGIHDAKYQIEMVYHEETNSYDVNVITDDVRVATTYNNLMQQGVSDGRRGFGIGGFSNACKVFPNSCG